MYSQAAFPTAMRGSGWPEAASGKGAKLSTFQNSSEWLAFVGRHHALQLGGARAGQAENDDGIADILVQDLRMAFQIPRQPQAVTRSLTMPAVYAASPVAEKET